MKYYDTSLYLFDDRYKALFWFISDRYGLEVPYDFEMPQEIKYLPKIVPMFGQGEIVPARWLISRITERKDTK